LVDVPIAAVPGRRYRRLSNKQRYHVDHHHGRHVDHRQIVGHAERRRIDLIPNRAIGALAERLGMHPTTLNRDLKPLKAQGLVAGSRAAAVDVLIGRCGRGGGSILAAPEGLACLRW